MWAHFVACRLSKLNFVRPACPDDCSNGRLSRIAGRSAALLLCCSAALSEWLLLTSRRHFWPISATLQTHPGHSVVTAIGFCWPLNCITADNHCHCCCCCCCSCCCCLLLLLLLLLLLHVISVISLSVLVVGVFNYFAFWCVLMFKPDHP